MRKNDSHCYFVATSLNDASVSRHFRALSEALVNRGHRVVLLVDGQRYDAEDHNSNPAIFTWPSKRPVKLRDARFLIGLIRKYRPQCLIANFGASNVMMLVGWLMSVPCRTGWYHTLSSQIDLDAKMERWKLNLLRWRKRLVFNAATHIVPASQAASKDVEQVFNIPHSKCRVFYNSLADPISIEADETEIKTSTQPTHRLVCAGRLFPTKGQDVLIRAVAVLKEKGLETSVDFLGCGPEEENLKNLASSLGINELCHFLGALPPDEVMLQLRTALVSVVPSRIDNNPLVVIESLSLGVPVVASGVGGILESMTDGVEGFLVQPDDHLALAEKLYALLNNPELHRTMSINARHRFLTQFEQKRIVTEQASWFESLVAQA